MEYGRNNEQHARDTIGRVHSRYLLFPFTHSILHIDQIMTTWIALLVRKSRLYPFTALASGTTAFSIRLNVIRGPFHCYVDGRNGRGGGTDRFWGGSIKGDDRYEGRFCVYGSGWLWKVLRVRRLYFLLSPPPKLCLCTFDKFEYWEAFVGSCSFQPANQSFAGSHIICAPRFPLASRDPGPLFFVTS